MIQLTRNVPVHMFESEATVAVGRDRPEFLAVARLAADLGRPIGARDVVRELLGNMSELIGRKVIDRCVALGLLEREERGPASLSESGRLALDAGTVLVPEEGLWRFYYAHDPLLENSLLHAERLVGESAKDERNELRSAPRGRERAGQGGAPQKLLVECQQAGPSVSVAKGHWLQLRQLGQAGQPVGDATLRLTLTWDTSPTLNLRGALPRSEGEKPMPVDATLTVPRKVSVLEKSALWTRLVSHTTKVPVHELERWRQAAGEAVLPTLFQEGNAPAMRAFRQDLEVPAIRIDGLGAFEPSTLHAVRLVPSTPLQAQLWLDWLQWQDITTYTTPPELVAKAQHLLARFPYHNPQPRSAAELLARARKERGDRAWNLLAPHDLGLWS